MVDADTLINNGIRIAVTAGVLGVFIFVLGRIVNPFVRTTVGKQMEGQPQVEIDKRTDTLSHVTYRTAMVVAVGIAVLTILPELGVNIAPLLAGAGLVGLAVGFGAQSLVKDAINGLFILVENQYAKGDVVNVAGIGGLVEDVNLRRTLVRDLDGVLHSIPNSVVAVASNHTKQWSRVHLDLAFPATEEAERVIGLIDGVGRELASDPAFAARVLAAPRAVWVDGLGAGNVRVKVLGDTLPGAQWEVASELRLRLQRTFLTERVPIA